MKTKKYIVSITVIATITTKIKDNLTIDHIINELDYSFADTTGKATVKNHYIEGFTVERFLIDDNSK